MDGLFKRPDRLGLVDEEVGVRLQQRALGPPVVLVHLEPTSIKLYKSYFVWKLEELEFVLSLLMSSSSFFDMFFLGRVLALL